MVHDVLGARDGYSDGTRGVIILVVLSSGRERCMTCCFAVGHGEFEASRKKSKRLES